MPAALSLSQRQAIVQSREGGESLSSIARRLHVSYDAVSRIDKRYRETGKIAPAYERCCQPGIRKASEIYEQAINLKASHPSWGAGLIWTELADSFDEDGLPSVRTLQRWFKQAGVQKPAIDRSPRPFVKRGKTAHEVWALDAKEELLLRDGSYVSWLTVTDEGSGAILDAVLFPPQTLDDGRSASGQSQFSSHYATLGTPGAASHG